MIARRGELSLTQRTLATKAGVDIKTIYNLESGERWPQAGTRAKIEKALGWVAGTLEALAEGADAGYEFPTRAELIDDGLRRSGLTPNQLITKAEISEQEWQELTAGSATITEARREKPALTPALARVALHLGLLPAQLDDAGQHQAADMLRGIIASAARGATAQRERAGASADADLRRLLDLWLQLSATQRRGVLGMIEEMLSESEESDSKPDLETKRRTG